MENKLCHLIPSELQESSPLIISSPDNTPKALGVHWDVAKDTLHIATPINISIPKSITKRVIASGTASVFDILGLFSPAIIPARLLLQDLWKLEVSWDAPVPDYIADKWILWLEHLPAITSLPISTCPQCQRAYARSLSHQMGLLPTTRITPSPPFTVTGVDFAGPFVLRRGHTRKPVLLKCYIVIFVCLSTKCVHLDLCASLSLRTILWPRAPHFEVSGRQLSNP